MSQSIRFLGLAVIAWAGVRAVSLGMVPGTQAFAFDVGGRPSPQPAALPPIQPTPLPPIEPVASAPPPGPAGYGPYASYGGAAYPAYAPYPIYVPVPAAASRSSAPQVFYIDHGAYQPMPTHSYFEPPMATEQPAEMAFLQPVPLPKTTPSFTDARIPPAFDRIQLSNWAMMRDQPGAQGLANGGTLGGSQAGARLLWRFNPQLAASLRTSAPINSQRGGEAALGVRYQPFTAWPVALTLERRHALGDYSGRSAFALFAEGGLYGRPMPWASSLDAYLQSGIVGVKNPDWFIDGQAAVTRPVWRNISAGLGMWGGAQPSLSRLDVGPRVSMRVGTRMRVHLDYRLKLAGNAEPGSGGVLTIGGDF